MWRVQWAVFTTIGALAATAFDAALLERKYGVFTGGFQAADQLNGIGDRLAFIATSLVADIAVIGVLVAMALWIASHARLTRAARVVVIFASALGPIFVADFFSYQLLDYLGDAVEFWVMLDMPDANPREIFAVASGHLVAPVLMIFGAVSGVSFLVWILERGFPDSPREAAAWATARSRILLLAAVASVGLITTALMRTSSDAIDNALRRKPSGELLGRIVTVASDVDRDGYGLLGRPRDPDPWNAQVFPYAIDVPGNGIDENGVGGDLLVQAEGAKHNHSGTGPWQLKPDVVLFCLESVRADTIGLIHNGQPVTPVLNRLAAQGVSARFAFSHNGWTVQSRYHLFSGRLSTNPGERTLIDDFKANGYQVAYFSGQVESFGGSEVEIGFDRADVKYDARVDVDRRYTPSTTPGSLAVPASLVQEKVNAFLDTRSSTQPLFLYVNFEDTHFPYYHTGIRPLISNVVLGRPDLRAKRAKDLRSMYLNTLANVDMAIGEVLDKVRRTLGKEPAVIVTSDHGESLFEEGFLGHGYALNDAQTRIPFIASNLPITITEPFGQADFRQALHAAFAQAGPTTSDVSKPVVKQSPSRRVFQYLGTVPRPTQIAFVGVGGRTIYDFRTGRVRVGLEDWRRPQDLGREEFQAFRDLVRFWEILVWRETQNRAG